MKNTYTNIILLAIFSLTLISCGDNSSRGEFEYVALGASDATGVGASPIDEGYVYEIQEELKNDGRDVGLLNLGIPGAQTDEVQNLALPVAKDDNPELVTIFVGANDIVAGDPIENFQNDLSEILITLANDTPALVVIATLPDITGLPRFQTNPDQDVTKARVDQFNAVIVDEATKSGALIVNLAAVPIQAFEVTDDGFHPNDEGHQLIADEFLKVIRANLPPVQP